ncbi:transposase [Polymorphospora sp. NPDC050346]|uniref:transposase n=1 Tax=Polymorphospora sp. NPDC050346 TaxID=3155780 RepID=UPI0033C97E04
MAKAGICYCCPSRCRKSRPGPERNNRLPSGNGANALRAGCEATVSETVRAHGLRHCRYRGLAKTHVQHILTAAGTNIVRLAQHRPDQHRRPRSRLQELFHTG